MIYDINKNQVKTNTIVYKHCTYLFAINPIKIEVLEGNCKVFLATDNIIENIQQSTIGFDSFNTGYTIFIPNNKDSIKLRFTDINSKTTEITLSLMLDEIIPEHYENLLVNYNLPTYKEISNAVIDNKTNIIKRLLLDFREILKYKGTTHGIEKFLYLLGYKPNEVIVSEEYQRFNTRKQQFEKITKIFENVNHKFTDENNPLVKTGDYFITINTWKTDDDDELTERNLPNRKLNKIQWIDKLLFAITLANKYFTTIEQDIVFHGLSFSTNIEKYQDVFAHSNQIIETNVNKWIKNVQIDISSFNLNLNDSYKFKSAEKFELVRDNFQMNTDVIRTKNQYMKLSKYQNILNLDFVKFLMKNSEVITNTNLLEYSSLKDSLEHEFYTEYRDPMNIASYESDFNTSMECIIKSNYIENDTQITNVDIKISNDNNPLDFCYLNYRASEYIPDLLREGIKFCWVTKELGTYTIEIKLTTDYGDVETYKYKYRVIDDIKYFQTKILSSFKVIENNNLTLEIDEPSITDKIILDDETLTSTLIRYTFNYSNENLSGYYDIEDVDAKRYLLPNDYYLLPDISNKNKVKYVTDTLPLKYTSSWIEYIVVPFEMNDTNIFDRLKIKLFDTKKLDEFEYKITETNMKRLEEIHNLFIRVLNIKNDKTYLFISTNSSGINMDSAVFDIYLDDVSIYDNSDIIIHKQPLNFDISYHVNNQEELIYPTNKNTINVIESTFQRLDVYKNNTLKIGDVVYLEFELLKNINIKWEVFDSFTGKKLFESKSEHLKFRIEYNTIFDVVYTVNIKNKEYRVELNNIFSSYEF